MDMLKDASKHPFLRATPTCNTDAVAEFTRKVLPRYSSLEDKQVPSRGGATMDIWAFAFGNQ